MMGLMSFTLILPLLLIGVIVYALGWRPQLGQSGPAQAKEGPLEILKARYARGEISRDEFDQARRDLEA